MRGAPLLVRLRGSAAASRLTNRSARAAGRVRSNRHQCVTVRATSSTGDVGLADR